MASFNLTGGRLTASGILDADAQDQLKHNCEKLLAGDAEVVTVDLSKVDVITSVCVGTLVALWIDLGSAGRRAKLKTSPGVRKVLEMTGLTPVLMREEGTGGPGS